MSSNAQELASKLSLRPLRPEEAEAACNELLDLDVRVASLGARLRAAEERERRLRVALGDIARRGARFAVYGVNPGHLAEIANAALATASGEGEECPRCGRAHPPGLHDEADRAEPSGVVLRDVALRIRSESQQLPDKPDPWGGQGPAILVSASAYFDLCDALGEVSQDEARALLDRQPNPLPGEERR